MRRNYLHALIASVWEEIFDAVLGNYLHGGQKGKTAKYLSSLNAPFSKTFFFFQISTNHYFSIEKARHILDYRPTDPRNCELWRDIFSSYGLVYTPVEDSARARLHRHKTFQELVKNLVRYLYVLMPPRKYITIFLATIILSLITIKIGLVILWLEYHKNNCQVTISEIN